MSRRQRRRQVFAERLAGIRGRILSNVKRAVSARPADMPGTRPPPGSNEAAALRELEQLVRRWSLADTARADELARQLSGYRALRAPLLRGIGRRASRSTRGRPVALRAWLGASLDYGAVAQADEAIACAGMLREIAGDPVWRAYARELARSARVLPGSRIAALDETLLFQGLPRPAVEAVEARTRLERFHRGDYLCYQGAEGRELLLLRSGLVAILRGLGPNEIFLGYGRPRESVMEMAYFQADRHRTASVRAEAETEAWVLPFSELSEITQEHADVRARLDTLYLERRIESRTTQEPRFASLDEAWQFALQRLLTVHTPAGRFSPGDRLARAGTRMTEVIFVLDGTVDQHLGSGRSAPRRHLSALADRGCLLGTQALEIAEVTWPGDVVAVSGGWVARAPVSRLGPLLRRGLSRSLPRWFT
jgi:CRP-like cAMP-binding protein